MEWLIVVFMLVVMVGAVWLDATITKPGKYGPSNFYNQEDHDN